MAVVHNIAADLVRHWWIVALLVLFGVINWNIERISRAMPTAWFERHPRLTNMLKAVVLIGGVVLSMWAVVDLMRAFM